MELTAFFHLLPVLPDTWQQCINKYKGQCKTKESVSAFHSPPHIPFIVFYVGPVPNYAKLTLQVLPDKKNRYLTEIPVPEIGSIFNLYIIA